MADNETREAKRIRLTVDSRLEEVFRALTTHDTERARERKGAAA